MGEATSVTSNTAPGQVTRSNEPPSVFKELGISILDLEFVTRQKMKNAARGRWAIVPVYYYTGPSNDCAMAMAIKVTERSARVRIFVEELRVQGQVIDYFLRAETGNAVYYLDVCRNERTLSTTLDSSPP